MQEDTEAMRLLEQASLPLASSPRGPRPTGADLITQHCGAACPGPGQLDETVRIAPASSSLAGTVSPCPGDLRQARRALALHHERRARPEGPITGPEGETPAPSLGVKRRRAAPGPKARRAVVTQEVCPTLSECQTERMGERQGEGQALVTPPRRRAGDAETLQRMGRKSAGIHPGAGHGERLGRRRHGSMRRFLRGAASGRRRGRPGRTGDPERIVGLEAVRGRDRAPRQPQSCSPASTPWAVPPVEIETSSARSAGKRWRASPTARRHPGAAWSAPPRPPAGGTTRPRAICRSSSCCARSASRGLASRRARVRWRRPPHTHTRSRACAAACTDTAPPARRRAALNVPGRRRRDLRRLRPIARLQTGANARWSASAAHCPGAGTAPPDTVRAETVPPTHRAIGPRRHPQIHQDWPCWASASQAPSQPPAASPAPLPRSPPRLHAHHTGHSSTCRAPASSARAAAR